MSDDDAESLSSEELIRRAREGLPTHDTSSSPSAELAREAAERLAADPPAPAPSDEDETEAGRIAGFTMDELLRLAGERHPAETAPPSSPPAHPEAEPVAGEETLGHELDGDLFGVSDEPDEAILGSPDVEPAPAQRRQRPIVFLIAIVLAFLALGNVLFDDTVATDDVEVGDCLLEPDTAQFASVTRVDCSEPHDLEVFAAITMGGVAYPGDEQILDTASDRCSPLFEEYVGAPLTDSEWAVQVFAPGPDLWDDGDRTVHCSLFLPDEAGGVVRVTGSAQNRGQ